jgi:hypothetical protein
MAPRPAFKTLGTEAQLPTEEPVHPFRVPSPLSLSVTWGWPLEQSFPWVSFWEWWPEGHPTCLFERLGSSVYKEEIYN